MIPSSRIYLAIEGIDGTGKTYVARHVAERFNFLMIQEPSSGEIGTIIRSREWDPVSDFFLFMADRADMLRRVPEGINIVSDRSLYSSFAYQGYHLWKRFQSIEGYFDFFTRTSKLLPMLPTHVFVLLCDVDLALNRVMERGGTSRFERRDYLEAVQKLYLELNNVARNVTYIDSNVTLNQLYESVDREVTRLLQQGRPP
ncbi:MAG: dTMP kinase [Thermoplasmata archaeon]